MAAVPGLCQLNMSIVEVSGVMTLLIVAVFLENFVTIECSPGGNKGSSRRRPVYVVHCPKYGGYGGHHGGYEQHGGNGGHHSGYGGHHGGYEQHGGHQSGYGGHHGGGYGKGKGHHDGYITIRGYEVEGHGKGKG
ncbi:unnamed protein product, partial [Meganyctiphanes norvegica]